MTGLQAEGVIDQALFVCGAEGSWPSPEAAIGTPGRPGVVEANSISSLFFGTNSTS